MLSVSLDMNRRLNAVLMKYDFVSPSENHTLENKTSLTNRSFTIGQGQADHVVASCVCLTVSVIDLVKLDVNKLKSRQQ